MGEYMGGAVSQARQKKKEQRREKENVCQIHSPYCKLPSRPPWTSPLGWRCLEDRGRRESKGGGQRNQRNSGVERCEGGGDRPGGRSQGGLHSQVLQLCPSGHGRNHPPCSSLWLLWSQKKRTSASSPSTVSASSSSSSSRSPLSSSSTLTTPTSTSSRALSAKRLARLTLT